MTKAQEEFRQHAIDALNEFEDAAIDYIFDGCGDNECDEEAQSDVVQMLMDIVSEPVLLMLQSRLNMVEGTEAVEPVPEDHPARERVYF